MEYKDLNNLDDNMQLMQNEYEEVLEQKKKTKPELAALKIIIEYVLLGTLWILFSDHFVNAAFKNPALIEEIQLYKGWFYVFVTGVIFYLIIYRVLNKYSIAINKLLSNFEELAAAHEELIAMNYELKGYIAEHDELQESLRAEKELLNRIFNDASSIFVVFDTNDNIIQYNPYAEEILGFQKEQMFGKKRSEVFAGIYNTEMEFLCKDGSYKTILWSNNTLHDKDGNITGVVSVGTDITARSEMENNLQRLAYYDNLTELPNKAYLEKEAAEAIINGESFAIVNLDLDNFKHINETMGHSVGDSYIQFVSWLLIEEIKDTDIVVRLSGDQFAFLIHTKESKKELYDWFELVLQRIRNPWNYNDQVFMITGSMGVAFYPEHGGDFSLLMQNSDIAMFYQKEHGKDGYTVFEARMFEKTLYNIVFTNQVKEAIERNEFILHYQPQFDLATGKIIGVEALVRWIHPEKGFISPAEFIPFSEQSGQIIPISEWVLKEALRQKIEWESKGYPHIKMAINFSGYIFNNKEIFDSICMLLKEVHIRPAEIEIEVTETAVMMELEKAKLCLHKLKELGISIAMDDFGTGYSSLNYLQMLPFDVLKIDKEFMKNIANEKEKHIYQMVVELAHKLGLCVVAEGIETGEQKDFLLCHNCDIGQGYFFSKPVTALEIEQLLVNMQDD